METLIRKLSSRKLWMSIIIVAAGIYLALGGDPTELERIIGTVTVLLGSSVYVVIEGIVDAASAKGADA